jgi:hypothetical protein
MLANIFMTREQVAVMYIGLACRTLCVGLAVNLDRHVIVFAVFPSFSVLLPFFLLLSRLQHLTL